MPEVGYDYDSIRREVAVYLGFSRDSSTWTTSEATDIDDTLYRGLNLFYAPTFGRNNTIHRWTFLRPYGVLTTQVGVFEYLLAEDFAGLDGDPTWTSDNRSLTTRIRVINEAYWRQLRNSARSTNTGPYYACIMPVRLGGQTAQRYNLNLYPTPGEEIVIEFRYLASQ